MKERGITLISLVVTIIVILILAGITINMALGDNGVIMKAKDSINANNIANVQDEINNAIASCSFDYYGNNINNISLSEYLSLNLYKYLKGTITNLTYNNTGSFEGGYIVSNYNYSFYCGSDNSLKVYYGTRINEMINEGEISIGSYIAYKPSTSQTSYTSLQSNNGSYNQIIPQENLNWRVLSISNEETVLISEYPTHIALELKGPTAVLNGVDELNNICNSLYSSNIGTARSINMNDVNKAIGNTPPSEYVGESGYSKLDAEFYPSFYEINIGNGIISELLLPEDVKINGKYYESVNGSSGASEPIGGYWIADKFGYRRREDGKEYDYMQFGIRSSSNSFNSRYGLYTYNWYGDWLSVRKEQYNFTFKPLRPVVVLNNNLIVVNTNETSNDGSSADKAFIISEK